MLARVSVFALAAALLPAAEPLTNQGLVQLAEAGYSEQFLLDLIKSRPARFDTSVEGLVFLARQGLSENLVRAVARLTTPAAPEPPPSPVRLRVTKKGELTTADGQPVLVLPLQAVNRHAGQ